MPDARRTNRLGCADFQRGRPTRRAAIRAGALGLAGLALPDLFRAEAAGAGAGLAGFGRAKACILVFMWGGPSQLDTWDPKPAAPEEVRGAFATTQTAVPGLRVCEHLPRLAGLAGRYAVLRSMTHDDLDHGSACYLALTGQFHPRKSSNPPPRPTSPPLPARRTSRRWT